jgi:hypothetical protein
MDDQRVWAFEESLWTADAEHYQRSIDDQCLMVLPTPPFVLTGQQAIDAVKSTPRWSEVEFSQQRISRPQVGLIVSAYEVHASKSSGESFEAYCTTTYRRLAHEDWRVVQHQQMVPPSDHLGSSHTAS